MLALIEIYEDKRINKFIVLKNQGLSKVPVNDWIYDYIIIIIYNFRIKITKLLLFSHQNDLIVGNIIS
jgi:hypothetical protein